MPTWTGYRGKVGLWICESDLSTRRRKDAGDCRGPRRPCDPPDSRAPEAEEPTIGAARTDQRIDLIDSVDQLVVFQQFNNRA